MTIVKPLGSNGEAPNILNKETPPAASSRGLGLAGVKSVSSHVEKVAENPPQISQVDPKLTVKAFALLDRGQTGAIDEPAMFDYLMPEHPKLGSMAASGNHIGFLPGVHWNLTFQAALDAGLPFGKAMKLADLVVKVDDLPGSQAPDHAYMHAMRAPGETKEHNDAAAKAYEATLRAMKNMHGLAGLLHRMQDSFSRSHTGPQGPLEWHGTFNEGPFTLLWHAWQDMTPGRDVQLAITKNGAALIKEYVDQCGGSLNEF